MTWTAEIFKARVGRDAEDDDLDRCNCEKAGQPGHEDCGICEHNMPLFECQECFVKPRQEIKRLK